MMTLKEAIKMSKQKWFREIRQFSLDSDDMPDGAFFAMAEEQDIDVSDWDVYAQVCEVLTNNNIPVYD